VFDCLNLKEENEERWDVLIKSYFLNRKVCSLSFCICLSEFKEEKGDNEKR